MSPPVQVLSSRLMPDPANPPRFRALGMKRSHAEAFCSKVERQMTGHLQPSSLRNASELIRSQYRTALENSNISMLPSFNHTLPTGEEKGAYLALDVGGTNFRVALVRLNGREHGADAAVILKRHEYRIDNRVRRLVGHKFFEWMAHRIRDAFQGDDEWIHGDQILPMGLAWSFPVQQYSVRDGALLQMGKDFKATDSLLGENLADLITSACQNIGLNVQLEAIVNDSSASVLSRAYVDDSTRVALIAGTGLNAGIHLPVDCFEPEKFGRRPSYWRREAHHVVVNSELSMFGNNIFALTRWDEQLRAAHPLPDFQPLEYLVSGGYLGEVVRLVLDEGISNSGMFGGQRPGNWTAYSLHAETLAAIEADTTLSLHHAMMAMQLVHPLPHGLAYSVSDIRQVQQVIKAVSTRAAAYLATSLHALLVLREEVDDLDSSAEPEMRIGCEGSFIEKYPGFRARVQGYLDKMFDNPGRVKLEITNESTLLGAAVAVSCHQ